MQVTLTIDDALLTAAQSAAKSRSLDLGKVISEWASVGREVTNATVIGLNGFPVFPARGKPITDQQVADLLADDGLSPGH